MSMIGKKNEVELKQLGRNKFGRLAKWLTTVILLMGIHPLLEHAPAALASGAGADISVVTNAVYGFGSNSNYELGQSETGDSSYLTPVPIPGLIDGSAISAGGYAGASHTLILTENGEVYSLGYGFDGQLGHGDTDNQGSPKKIEGLEGVKAIAAGGSHSLVLTEGGEVYSFGLGFNGQLGHGDQENQLTPKKIDGLEGVTAIAAGAHHSLILTESGEVYSFGYGWTGQLGHGNTTSVSSPMKIEGLHEVKRISSSGNHALLLMENGQVYSFGQGVYGQLGHGEEITESSPRRIEGLENVKEVAAGGVHSLILLQNGEVYSFGYGGYGQLGHGDFNAHSTPKKIEELDAVMKIAAGWDHSLVLLENGEVHSFGQGWVGQLGNGGGTNQNSPQLIDGLDHAKSIHAGFAHSLVLKEVALIPMSSNRTKFDKNPTEQEEIVVSAAPNGSVFIGLWNGTMPLVRNTDYSVIESGYNATDETYEAIEINLHPSYLLSLPIGSETLKIGFEVAGTEKFAELELSISDSTPNNSSLSISQSSFDKWKPHDIIVTALLNGNTFTGIANEGSNLILDTDYMVMESDYSVTDSTYQEVDIKLYKSYLSGLPTGHASLTFQFNVGDPQELELVITNSMPSGGSQWGSPTEPIIDSEDEEDKGEQSVLLPGITLKPLETNWNASDWLPSDIGGHWAADPIRWFIQHQLIAGYPDGSFHPDREISRAEFVMLLSRIFEVENVEATSGFRDIENHWAQSEIVTFASFGVIQGYESGLFRPDQSITREEIVVILSRIIHLDLLPEESNINFVDIGMAADYAQEAITQAGKAGIVNGLGNSIFNPKGVATRAETVQMLMNTLQYL